MEKQWAFLEIGNEIFLTTYTKLKKLQTNNGCQLHGGNFGSDNFCVCVCVCVRALSGWLETHNISTKASNKYTMHMRDSWIGNLTRLWAEFPRNRGHNFGMSERFAVQRNVQTGSEGTLLFNVYLRLSFRVALDNTDCRHTFTLVCVYTLQKITAVPSCVVRYKDREADIS